MIIVLWIVLSVAVGYWNKERGNSFLVGLLVSLIFSPLIGVVMVLITNGGRKCPYCRESIRKDAIRCKHCGSTLNNNLQTGDFIKS